MISGQVKNNNIFLSARELKLLKTLKDDHEFLAGFPSQRPMTHYARMYGVSERTIRYDFANLESHGLCWSSPGGKGNPRKRCISSEGISYLVNQASGYIAAYNSPIPYIDLSDQEMINSEIIKEAQICGQNLEVIQDADEKLDLILQSETPKVRECVKKAIKASEIGPERTEKIINRVIAVLKKNTIHNKKSYFLACVQDEQRKIRETWKVLYDKPIIINMYAQP